MIKDTDFKLVRFDFINPNLECMSDYDKSIVLLDRHCPLYMLSTGFKRFCARCFYDFPTDILMSSEVKDKTIHVVISNDDVLKWIKGNHIVINGNDILTQLEYNLRYLLQTKYKIPNLKNVIIYGR